MILGIDVSTYLEQQKIARPIYKKDGQGIDPFEAFIKQGVTHLRTRVWNDPYDESGKPYLGGTCDLANFIALAKTLEKYHFKHVLDFHYSDFWVDPSKQFLPKAWKDFSFDELVKAVYEFTKESLLKIKEEGIDLEIVQAGNEITHGMLWPYGKLLYREERPESFDRLATLLKSAHQAIREVYPKAKILLHLEQSYDQLIYRDIISNLLNRGVKLDIIGSSYYPFWHHGFDEYFSNMDMVRNEFGLEVMNIELGFPFTTKDYRRDESGELKQLVINDDNIKGFMEYMPYYPSPEGQARFIEEFLKLAKEHKLSGVFYWEPLWVPGEGICWASKEAQIYQMDIKKDTRNEWANQCLFDYEANALPALYKYKI